jgi:hypothetical protein
LLSISPQTDYLPGLLLGVHPLTADSLLRLLPLLGKTLLRLLEIS